MSGLAPRQRLKVVSPSEVWQRGAAAVGAAPSLCAGFLLSCSVAQSPRDALCWGGEVWLSTFFGGRSEDKPYFSLLSCFLVGLAKLSK